MKHGNLSPIPSKYFARSFWDRRLLYATLQNLDRVVVAHCVQADLFILLYASFNVLKRIMLRPIILIFKISN
jgi:hypothetical protein